MGRVTVKEKGHVRNWEGITSVMLVVGSSSIFGFTGYMELSCACRASTPSGDVGSPIDCIWASCVVRMLRIVGLLSSLCGRYK